jgi:hypothetical protein
VRTTRVQKFTWNADGTPNFGVPVSLDTALTVPSGETTGAVPPTGDVYYALVTKAGDQCVDSAGQSSASKVRMSPCSSGMTQQWSVSYLGNGHYHIGNRASGLALEVAGGPSATQDGLPIDQAAWTHSPNQQWRFQAAEDGWLQLEARHSGKALDAGTCGTAQATGVYQQSSRSTDCQQFRLQPVDGVQIVNANSGKVVLVEQGVTADGAHVVLASGAGASNGRWSFVHQDQGYYQVKAAHSGLCLDVAGSTGVAGAEIEQRTCGSPGNQQWRIEPLNDGMIRLVARPGGMVLDVINCRMADGTQLQEWTWLNNPCQRFHFAAP